MTQDASGDQAGFHTGWIGSLALGLICAALVTGAGLLGGFLWSTDALGGEIVSTLVAGAYIVPLAIVGYAAGWAVSLARPNPWLSVAPVVIAGVVTSLVVLFDATFVASGDPLIFLVAFWIGFRGMN